MGLLLSDFQYDLPEDLIAQTPASRREDARLMVLDRQAGTIEHSRFSAVGERLAPGSLLVVNDTRVVPVRVFGRRETGGRIEVFLLEPPRAGAGPGRYELDCLTRPSRRLTIGTKLFFDGGLTAEVTGLGEAGRRRLAFEFPGDPVEVLGGIGRMPLPPYIRRNADAPEDPHDRERYQTVYASVPGAVAAPTAGLHFSRELLAGLEAGGIETARVTLHVGYGTFAPVREEDLARHRMHTEEAFVAPETAAAVNRARSGGRDVVAVGTTVVRTLEHAGRAGRLEEFAGPVDLFITPGYEFRMVNRLITNFHLPGSTLLMLVSALAGREFILEAYREAVTEGYRFYSYGDAMLIL